MPSDELKKDVLDTIRHCHVTLGELVEDSFHKYPQDKIRTVVYELMDQGIVRRDDRNILSLTPDQGDPMKKTKKQQKFQDAWEALAKAARMYAMGQFNPHPYPLPQNDLSAIADLQSAAKKYAKAAKKAAKERDERAYDPHDPACMPHPDDPSLER